MSNSDRLEKSRGAVMFAFNTECTDYIKIAQRSARLIKQFLKIPVTLISDVAVLPIGFDSLITVGNNFPNFKNANQPTWRNGDRFRAYELSPYDETLLIDSDYLVLTNSLDKIFESTEDYRLFHDNHVVGEQSNHTMGITSLPFLWATVVVFKKTQKTQLLFELVKRVQQNYEYYRMIYNIQLRHFRNDYAFTIANSIVNGYNLAQSQSIPWQMTTFHQPLQNIELNTSKLIVRTDQRAYVLPKQNIHVMDKKFLLTDDFQQFVDVTCQN